MRGFLAYLERCAIEFDAAVNVLTGGKLGQTVSLRGRAFHPLVLREPCQGRSTTRLRIDGARCAPGDIDTRTKNFASDLAQIPDTSSSVSGVTITRTDGSATDLPLAAQPGVDSTATQVTLEFSGGIAGVIYKVSITVWVRPAGPSRATHRSSSRQR
jgi:hypothetical protein